jgi:hypothetical protein
LFESEKGFAVDVGVDLNASVVVDEFEKLQLLAAFVGCY